jgi:signal transduction histidine kinase
MWAERTVGSAAGLPYLVSGIGIALLLLLAGEVLAVATGASSLHGGFLVGAVTSAVFLCVLIYGGYWLEHSGISPERYGRIARWVAGGLLGAVGIIFWVNMSMRSVSPGLAVATIRWGGAVGGCLGLIGGVLQARAIERAVEAERTRQRLEEAERERTRLAEFARIVSHDLRNPLSVAQGNLVLLRDEFESPHLESLSAALARMDSITEDTLVLARAGLAVGETEPVCLSAVATTCWQTVSTAEARLRIEGRGRIEADEGRLRHLLENLFRNAVTHGGPDVTVRVGILAERSGFYVEDDGPGIPESEHETVFETGYSTADSGTGFGLSIVETVAEAHGWEITVSEGAAGGARFEITGVESVERDTPTEAAGSTSTSRRRAPGDRDLNSSF